MNLDRRITVEQATESADDFGAAGSVSWSTYCTRWARVEAKATGSKEQYEGQREVSMLTTIFHLRRDSTTKNITPKMRISYDGNYYDIQFLSENPDQRRRGFLMIEAKIQDD